MPWGCVRALQPACPTCQGRTAQPLRWEQLGGSLSRGWGIAHPRAGSLQNTQPLAGNFLKLKSHNFLQCHLSCNYQAQNL